MKVVSIGTDKKMFEDNSAVLLRSLEYASKMKELHIVVFSLKSDRLTAFRHKNLFIYPTNSISRASYVFDAIKIGGGIIKKGEFSINSSVITCQDPFETGIVGVFLKRAFHLPLQIQVHTDFLSPYFKNSLLNHVRLFISNFTIPKANGIRVVSSTIKESIEKKYPNINLKINILPIFVDTEGIFNFVNSKNEKVEKFSKDIFMFSRLSKEKRFDTALKSFKKVVDKFPDAGLTIFGDGKEEKSIKKMIMDLGLEGNVILNKPKINTEILLDFKKNQGIFLLTSEFEGYAMTLIEVGSLGFPIVTTEVGIAKTSLFKNKENCLICPVEDVDCISKSVIDFITNEEKRKSFGNNLRDSIKNISLSKETSISQNVGLLESIIKK